MTRIAGRRLSNGPAGKGPDRIRAQGVTAPNRRCLEIKESSMHVIRFFQDLARDEEGVTAIEYGLIAALIAVVIIAAVEAVGGGVSSTFNSVADKLPAK
jgi:pilus assembly protein Flp/PilA